MFMVEERKGRGIETGGLEIKGKKEAKTSCTKYCTSQRRGVFCRYPGIGNKNILLDHHAE